MSRHVLLYLPTLCFAGPRVRWPAHFCPILFVHKYLITVTSHTQDFFVGQGNVTSYGSSHQRTEGPSGESSKVHGSRT